MCVYHLLNEYDMPLTINCFEKRGREEEKTKNTQINYVDMNSALIAVIFVCLSIVLPTDGSLPLFRT